MLPTKLNGIATATAIACAGSSATVGADQQLEHDRLIPSASTLTVKKRAAWKPAWPCFASKVQCRFHMKLLVTATQKAPIAAGMWWTSSDAAGEEAAKTARRLTT